MAPSNIQAIYQEEWDFSQPDRQERWQQAARRVIRGDTIAATGSSSISGTVLRYQRKPSGRWEGDFVRGAPAEPTLRNVYIAGFQGPWVEALGATDLWPTGEVQVGETWPVQPANLPNFGVLQDPVGKAEGKLVALNRNDAGERAEIEYSFDIEAGAAGNRGRHTGTIRMHLDLKAMWVTSCESRHHYSSRSESSEGNVAADSVSTHTTQFTVR
jgi:hypothetical protein